MIKGYMQEAIKEANNSIDPNTKVGCVIVNNDQIISRGHNCLPVGLQACDYPLEIREGEFLETKYPYMIHSEAQAIVNAKCCLEGSSLYVTLFPCNECAKLIIQAGIKDLYYNDDKYADTDIVKASKRMLKEAGINLVDTSKMDI